MPVLYRTLDTHECAYTYENEGKNVRQGIDIHDPALEQAYAYAEAHQYDDAIAEVENYVARHQEIDPRIHVRLMKLLVDWYAQDQHFAQARRYAAQAARIAHERLEPHDELALIARNSDLYWKCVCGYDDIARRDYPTLIRDAEKYLGNHHPLTYAIRNNSAMPFKICGDYEQAAQKYAELKEEMNEDAECDGSLKTMVAFNEAEAYALSGHPEKSTEIYQELIENIDMSKESNRIYALRIRHEIAANIYDSGEVEKATQMWNALLHECRETLGEYHPLTMKQKMLHISLFIAQKDWVAVKKLCAEILESPENTLPSGWREEIEIIMKTPPPMDLPH
ncbi:hypothetical protein [Schaalia sp. lx-260]|uniref:hypothetical protein n=1 Tax=Schaalia sp. lx-260 TaxID=2899082 RepID=UPI001E2A1179|nr:hypothetical protein [Schaalia sp. lx-260]MCD4549466.1 hypothetical protein [Schaalia sp. lx-260]